MPTNPIKISRVVARSRLAALHYGVAWPSVLSRVVRLRLRERFRPKESFLWGLADPRRSQAEIDRYVSRSTLYRLQAVHNPRSLSYLTENKRVFYAFCRGAEIPIPELYAVLHLDGGYCLGDGARLLAGRAAWHEYFAEQAPERFVIKPARGVYARGLRVLTRSADGHGFVEPGGRELGIDDLLDALSADRRYSSFVVQETLVNDPELRRLSGSQALQTVRAVTLVDEKRRPRLLFACCKVINSDHLSDNFDYGTSGNLLADVDLESGRLRQARGRHESGFGLHTHDRHPRTDVPFDDFVLPHWPATRRAVEEAAVKFLPLRTIGWDVAITPEGPSIIEGNVWWDPLHNAHQHMPAYLRTFE